jgi:hypothetical protein
MKALSTILLIASFAIFSSCTYKVYHVKSMPPGHAKKMTGSKSAKHHAPGHKKMHKR